MGKTPPLDNNKERSFLQHMESCTEIRVGKTPPLIMGKSEMVYCTTSGVMHWSLIG